ncbi:MAG: hypothetical protein ACQEQC_01435 [Elusimicrobiota bacterium]
MKKLVSLGALVGVAVLVSGCGPNPSLYRKMFYPVNKIVKSGPVFQIQIDGPTEANVGDVLEITATAVDENNREVTADINWEVDDSFELISEEGNTAKVEAVSSGLSFINAETEEESGTLGIQVKE